MSHRVMVSKIQSKFGALFSEIFNDVDYDNCRECRGVFSEFLEANWEFQEQIYYEL